MRLCQLCQFIWRSSTSNKGCVSCVSPSPAVFKPSGGWRGFHGILAMGRKYAGDRLPQLTQPRVDLSSDISQPRTNCEPAAREIRADGFAVTPQRQRGKKTTLINFDTRGIRSGDAIILG